MNQDEYIEQRLQDQIGWYSGKSAWNQRGFKWLRLMEIISAALIPFLSAMGDRVPAGPWVIGLLGVVIAVAAAAGSLYKFHENWIQYRTTAEQLKHEKFLFLTGTRPYDDEEDRLPLLVQRVEGLLSKEHSAWALGARRAGQTSLAQPPGGNAPVERGK